jgi:murein DD-endopeptidase MepM/ murein hydrolase activator NlpD
MGRPVITIAALLLGLGAVLLGPAGAQEPPPPPPSSTTSSTDSTTTSVTTPGETTTSTTTTTVPSTTTTTIDPKDPGQAESSPPEPVPLTPATVPPRLPAPGVYAKEAAELLRRQLAVAEAEAVDFRTAYDEAKLRVVTLQSTLDRLERAITAMSNDQRAAVRQVEATRRRFEARAADALIRGDLDELAVFAEGGDPHDIARAAVLLSSVLDADRQALVDYQRARKETDSELVDVADRLVETRIELAGARAKLVETRRANVEAQFNLKVFAAGSEIVIHGFVFPVGEPHSFGDSFGAPRMMGTSYEHAHQGTDIMAPMGTPLLACERGIVTKMGNGVLGGTTLWVKGESGTYYYYAHLSAFAPGMKNGTVVEAGTVVGFVGDTGNAKGGAPHLHFEIHPDGGAAVNPYPLLKVVDDLGPPPG